MFFSYGIWSTLSQQNFRQYVDSFDSSHANHEESWSGWFSNRLKGYPDTLNLKCLVYPQNGRQRPLVEIMDSNHPLAQEQKQGIDLDRILELYALNGHHLEAQV